MKKTMILGLCLALIASIIMIGGEVKAEVTPQATASVDKTTLKKGDTVTLTVKFPKNLEKESDYTEQYFIKFDNEKFSYKRNSMKLTGYTGSEKGADYFVLTDTNGTDIPENFSGNQIYVYVGGIFEEGQIVSGFSVQFEVKEDLTATTLFNVSKLNENADNIEYTLDISVNPVKQANPENNPATNKPADKNSGKLDDSPKTGVVNKLVFVVPVVVLSILGIAILEKRKVK